MIVVQMIPLEADIAIEGPPKKETEKANEPQPVHRSAPCEIGLWAGNCDSFHANQFPSRTVLSPGRIQSVARIGCIRARLKSARAKV